MNLILNSKYEITVGRKFFTTSVPVLYELPLVAVLSTTGINIPYFYGNTRSVLYEAWLSTEHVKKFYINRIKLNLIVSCLQMRLSTSDPFIHLLK